MKNLESNQKIANRKGYSYPSEDEIKFHSTSEADNPAVYVGTYGKYNNGYLDGMWVDLTTFVDYEEFIDFCKSIHCDEDDPELMFQDYENFPNELYDECMGEEDFDRIMFYAEYEDKDKIDAYLSFYSAEEIEDIDDHYIGYAESEEEYARQYFEDCYPSDVTDSSFVDFIDFEDWGRNLLFDYNYENGYIFE